MQGSISYPVLHLMKLTLLFCPTSIFYLSLLYFRSNWMSSFTLLLKEVDPDTKVEIEFMTAATQKQGPSRGGGYKAMETLKELR